MSEELVGKPKINPKELKPPRGNKEPSFIEEQNFSNLKNVSQVTDLRD